MSEKNIIFNNEKINKSNLYKNEKLFNIDVINVNKKLSSEKEQYGTKSSLKYCIWYNDTGVIRPFFIKLPQIIGYVKCFDSNKATFFRSIYNKLL